jgi:folate-binding protein YgfZ
MGMAKVNAYVLLMQGEGMLRFLDGLSCNLVEGSCTTVFTDKSAKIIDACDVIDMGESVAVIGYGDVKERLSRHFLNHLLGQNIQIRDISSLNKVFIGDGNDDFPLNATLHEGWFGTVAVLSNATEFKPTWSLEDWNEHRISNMIPFAGHEITSRHHPYACGLGALVHDQKGCYIGQEVLTRMRSRGRYGHRLVSAENPVSGATTVGRSHSLCIVRDQ